MPLPIELADLTFRANPEYELICADKPEEVASESSEGPHFGKEFYGFFHARTGSTLHRRKASVDAALLFLSLLRPRKLPQYILPTSKTAWEHVARLVLDSILEVEYGGCFVSGGKASQLLREEVATVDPLGQLSIEALQYAHNLVGLPQDIIANRLYFYGAMPATVGLYQRFADEESVLRYVMDASFSLNLEKYWFERPPAEQNNPWRKWFFKGRVQQGEANYKLYISPAVGDLRGIVTVTAETLQEVDGIYGFKIGRNVETLCRSDKMVAYFYNKNALRHAADVLLQRFSDRQAHGVPFTSQISANGLLSWGADPPSIYATDGKQQSWRFWVVTQLARYLSSRESRLDVMESWEFALQRLRLAGVDTDKWTPPIQSWSLVLARI